MSKKHTIVVTIVLALIICAVLYRQRASTQNNFADHPVKSVQPAVLSASPESAAGENNGLPVQDAVSAPIPTIEYASEPKVIHFGTATRSDEEIQEERQLRELLEETASKFDLTTVEGYRQWLVEMVALEESGIDTNPNQSLSVTNPDIDPALFAKQKAAMDEAVKAQMAEMGITPFKPTTAAERLERFDSLTYEEQEKYADIYRNPGAAGVIRLSNGGNVIEAKPRTITLEDGSTMNVLGGVVGRKPKTENE